jgi:hypothetical protein
MEPEDLLTCLKEPTTDPCPEPPESIPTLHTIFLLRLILIGP